MGVRTATAPRVGCDLILGGDVAEDGRPAFRPRSVTDPVSARRAL